MPKFISKDGMWYVAKERVGLINRSNKTVTNPSAEWSKYANEKIEPGQPFIYEGPDRASLFELFKIDSTGQVLTMGQDFHDDPDMQDRARQRGYKSVADYAKAFGYVKEKSDARFEELIAKVETHDLPKRVQMIEATETGGTDTVGNEHRKGGFGEIPRE